MRVTLPLLVLAAALSCDAAEIDLAKILMSDAIVRVHVTETDDGPLRVDVLEVLYGDASLGRIKFALGSVDEHVQNDSIVVLVRGGGEWHVRAIESTDPQAVEGLRRTIATLPRWSSRGPVSVISYCEPCEIPSGTIGPIIAFTIGYRNDTDERLELPGGLYLQPHEVLLKRVSRRIRTSAGRSEIEIPYHDGTWAFDPIHVVVR